MINSLKEKFSQIDTNSCLEIIVDKEFEIYDCSEKDTTCTTGRCYIRENGQFRVINNQKKEIGFLAIDKCIFFDNDEFQKCDCLVFDKNTICFIEIKDCIVNQRKKRKKTAKAQLLLKYFKKQ
jgi:hypothetical protein